MSGQPDVRLLLLGVSGHGKSATGNSILGEKLFKAVPSMVSVTTCAAMARRTVNGRNIVVVDTPGLSDDRSNIEQAVMNAKEVFDTELCGEGFDAFVLVYKFGQRMTEDERVSIDNLKEVFGKDVFRDHTVLLITFGDNFQKLEGQMTCREWCELNSGFMKYLLQECDSRCVLFDNKTKDEAVLSHQRQQLLSYIDDLQAKMKPYTNTMFTEVERQRNLNREQQCKKMNLTSKTLMNDPRKSEPEGTVTMPSLPDLHLLLLGKNGHGKSASGNSILGANHFKSAPGFEPVTTCPKKATETIKGRNVTVIDTPGLTDTRFNTEISLLNAMEVFSDCVALCPDGFDALVLVFEFGESMTDDERVSMEALNTVLGEDFIRKYIIVLMTHGDNFDQEEVNMSFSEWCLSRTGFMSDLLQECDNRCVLFNNKTKSKKEISHQRQILLDYVDQLPSKGKRFTELSFNEEKDTQTKPSKDRKSAGYSNRVNADLVDNLPGMQTVQAGPSKMKDTSLPRTFHGSPARSLPVPEKRRMEDQDTRKYKDKYSAQGRQYDEMGYAMSAGHKSSEPWDVKSVEGTPNALKIKKTHEGKSLEQGLKDEEMIDDIEASRRRIAEIDRELAQFKRKKTLPCSIM